METIEIIKLLMGSAGLIGLFSFIFKSGKKIAQIDARFDQIDSRFDHINARFDRIDARFDCIDVEFENVHKRIDNVEKKVQEVQDGLSSLKVEFARMEGRTESIQPLYTRRHHR